MSAIEKAKNYMKSGIRQSGLMIVPLALMAVHAEASTVTTYLDTQTINGSVSGPGLNSGGSFSNNLSNLIFTNGVAIGTLVRGTKITGDAYFTNNTESCGNSSCTIEIVAEGVVAVDGVPAPGAYLKYDFNVYLQQILSISSFSISPQAIAIYDYDYAIDLSINGSNRFSTSGSANFGDSVNNGPTGDYFTFPTLNGFTDTFVLSLSITPVFLEDGETLVVNIPDNTLQIAGTRDIPGGAVPEPASMALVAAGIAALCFRRFRG